MKRSLLFGAFLALVVVSLAFAQGKPNFSGTWTLDPAKSEMGGGGGRGMGGGTMTVTQDDKQLTVERTMGENTMKSVYNLDGTETTHESARGGKMTSTTKWDGSKLVVTTKGEGPNGPMERTQTWSLNADGTLTIEQPSRQGGTMKMVYNKKS